MKPGRELDALIAEHVMGIKLQEPCSICNGTGYIDYDRCHVCHYSKGHKGIKLNYYPDYSTDISAAWEVVNHLKLSIELMNDRHDSKWSAIFLSNGEMGGYWAHSKSSAPHAICLAALKAVGHEIS